MYMYAWKKGLKTTYYLRSRPATADCELAPVPIASTARRLRSLENPEALRGLPDEIVILDPGMNLTLRPMQYPDFFDTFKDAIKNTWTVEEVDLSYRPYRPAKMKPANSIWSNAWSPSSLPATLSWRTTSY